MEKKIKKADVERFAQYLLSEEKSAATIEKYSRDAARFAVWLGGAAVTKERTIAYKQQLVEAGYAVRSVNSILSSVNSFLSFLGLDCCRVKCLRTQRQIYCAEEKELSKAEYMRLLDAAGDRPRTRLLLETICGTGIRVSELRYFTVEAVRHGDVTVACKGKSRTILVPGKLRALLLDYARKTGVKSGAIFRTNRGRPMDRSSIWREMKKLCVRARVSPKKVFPHNLRKLFARTFYRAERDIARLADILGHSSINTTRIYIISTGLEHRHKIERLGLVV